MNFSLQFVGAVDASNANEGTNYLIILWAIEFLKSWAEINDYDFIFIFLRAEVEITPFSDCKNYLSLSIASAAASHFQIKLELEFAN